MVTLHGSQFKPYISALEISTRLNHLAHKINHDYEGKQPLFIVVLNGAFMFAADMMRRFEGHCEIRFVRLRSYSGMSSEGQVEVVMGLEEDIMGRHIIILEDIIDTGETMTAFLKLLHQKAPASIAICALLYKPNAIKHPLDIAYTGFEIPNAFVVGYGLDYDGLGRNLPEIYQLTEVDTQ